MTTQETKDALSSTPRTDAVAFMITNERARREAVFADFARQLERELNEALDKASDLAMDNIDLRASLRREENAREVLAETNKRLEKSIGLLINASAQPFSYDDWKNLFEKGAILP